MTSVRIYKPAKTAMQSGRAKAGKWVLEMEPQTRRGPEPLMGWTSAGDTAPQVKLSFEKVEDAVAYAEGKGWTYTLTPSQERKVKPRNYTDNFKYVPAESEKR